MVKKTKQEKLKQSALKAERIKHTLQTSGWKDIAEIFQDAYNDAMNELLKKENPEARGAINIITEIMENISTELQFGDNARKKYNEQYLNINTPQG